MTNFTNRKREGAAQWKARKKEMQSYAGSKEEEWSAVTECRRAERRGENTLTGKSIRCSEPAGEKRARGEDDEVQRGRNLTKTWKLRK